MSQGILRRTVFWIIDYCKGGKIHSHYCDVRNKNDNNLLNVEQLQSLLSWAKDEVPYYSAQTELEISKFPVINKNIIKENWEGLHATSMLDQPVHHMSTGGSTGTPFTMEWDMNKRRRQIAELIYYNELAGHKLGQRNAYCRIWNDKNRKTWLGQIKENLLPIDITHLDEAHMNLIAKKLVSWPRINMCLAYASFYETLCNFMTTHIEYRDKFRIKTIISGSEVLTNELKYKLKELLSCKVIDRYSNEENGFLAQTGDCSDIFCVNTASFYVEILSLDDDEPVENGELGRIVVTDLYNRVIPVIRYDTGDLGIKFEEKDAWTTKIESIQGRRVDVIYDSMGNMLSPIAICNYMWGYDKLRQFQLIQSSAKEYTMKLNGARGNYSDEEIIKRLKEVLGDAAKISIEHVNGIPCLDSGKFKKTVCSYRYNSRDYI